MLIFYCTYHYRFSFVSFCFIFISGLRSCRSGRIAPEKSGSIPRIKKNTMVVQGYSNCLRSGQTFFLAFFEEQA
ncbi:hypothetical protein EYC84_007566 [Monilinia fructicola]|uniref:Uncharacterized protein n=1 Tax=Monilinia fructicola TaxID=38448 RepID=A0A5M9JLC9_MONFR|nr:hypothetical protein EYC84_007566 [Monilinia fructicola]